MDQQFSVRWNNYFNQITDAFGSLRNDEDLVDVTLSCEGKKLKAHKMLLSACSSYFRDIFKDNPCQHPVIVFRNVKYADLEAIIDFMYKGEVNVIQDQFESFLGTAEMLEVKGLTDGSGKDGNMEEDETSTLNKRQESSQEVLQENESATDVPISQRPVTFIPVSSKSGGPPVKKRKYNEAANLTKSSGKKQTPSVNEVSKPPIEPKIEKDDYIEDLTYDVDDDDLASPPTTEHLQILRNSNQSDNSVDFNTNSNSSHDQHDNNMLVMGQMIVGEPGPSVDGLALDSLQEDFDFSKPYLCGMCQRNFKTKGQLNTHMELHSGETTCPICHKVYSRRQRLQEHFYKVHGGPMQYI